MVDVLFCFTAVRQRCCKQELNNRSRTTEDSAQNHFCELLWKCCSSHSTMTCIGTLLCLDLRITPLDLDLTLVNSNQEMAHWDPLNPWMFIMHLSDFLSWVAQFQRCVKQQRVTDLLQIIGTLSKANPLETNRKLSPFCWSSQQRHVPFELLRNKEHKLKRNWKWNWRDAQPKTLVLQLCNSLVLHMNIFYQCVLFWYLCYQAGSCKMLLWGDPLGNLFNIDCCQLPLFFFQTRLHSQSFCFNFFFQTRLCSPSFCFSHASSG